MAEPNSDAQLRLQLQQYLTTSGERERLKAMLRQQLIANGWYEQVQILCQEVVAQTEHGNKEWTVDELVAHVLPSARERVPPQIREQFVQEIEAQLQACLKK